MIINNTKSTATNSNSNRNNNNNNNNNNECSSVSEISNESAIIYKIVDKIVGEISDECAPVVENNSVLVLVKVKTIWTTTAMKMNIILLSYVKVGPLISFFLKTA